MVSLALSALLTDVVTSEAIRGLAAPVVREIHRRTVASLKTDETKIGDYVPKSYRKATKVMARDIELAVIAADDAMKDAGLKTKAYTDAPEINPQRFGCNIGAGLINTDLNELTTAMHAARDGNRLDLQNTPVAVQYPDWNNWLPDIHPLDAYTGIGSATPFLRAQAGGFSASAAQAFHAKDESPTGVFLPTVLCRRELSHAVVKRLLAGETVTMTPFFQGKRPVGQFRPSRKRVDLSYLPSPSRS